MWFRCFASAAAATSLEEGTCAYDDMSNLSGFTDLRGRVTAHEHDSEGNRAKTLRDYGGQNWATTMEYDALDRVERPAGERCGQTADSFAGVSS